MHYCVRGKRSEHVQDFLCVKIKLPQKFKIKHVYYMFWGKFIFIIEITE